MKLALGGELCLDKFQGPFPADFGGVWSLFYVDGPRLQRLSEPKPATRALLTAERTNSGGHELDGNQKSNTKDQWGCRLPPRLPPTNGRIRPVGGNTCVDREGIFRIRINAGWPAVQPRRAWRARGQWDPP
jgi:hypothetical protein